MTELPDESDHSTDSDARESEDAELPESVLSEVTRLTRLARRTADDAEADAYRQHRDDLLAEYGYTARVRDADDVLVCHPAEWLEDGTVVLDRVDDVDRGVELSLGGPGDDRSWEAVRDRNEEVVAAIETAHDTVHAENARALATFANNHYAKPIGDLTAAELREFRTDYFRRNAFPTDEQKAALDASIRLVYDRLDVPMPDDEA